MHYWYVCVWGHTCEERLQLDGAGSHLSMDDSRDQAQVIRLCEHCVTQDKLS